MTLSIIIKFSVLDDVFMPSLTEFVHLEYPGAGTLIRDEDKGKALFPDFEILVKKSLGSCLVHRLKFFDM